jgi:hypothetical protein
MRKVARLRFTKRSSSHRAEWLLRSDLPARPRAVVWYLAPSKHLDAHRTAGCDLGHDGLAR